MGYQTDRQRVEGLGSAKDGTVEWWKQRVAAVALIPLVFLFVVPLLRAVGSDFNTVREIYQSPFNAITGILFFIVIMSHLRQGLQEVIVDYVHGKATMTISLLANTMFTTLIGITGVFSIAKIAFSG
ncbi:MAG: succinate dehydrogenase, hydrophobic membrane anchor protein [Rhodobacteraceae bacterium]|nr:succinate dehydrogenase, hydrophobic membrane anchor protein [Paracoccaceae bacterium]